jgi:hypothetical protein
MNHRYHQLPRSNAAGLATGSILALIVAMAISLLFNVQPANAFVRATAAHTILQPRLGGALGAVEPIGRVDVLEQRKRVSVEGEAVESAAGSNDLPIGTTSTQDKGAFHEDASRNDSSVCRSVLARCVCGQ